MAATRSPSVTTTGQRDDYDALEPFTGTAGRVYRAKTAGAARGAGLYRYIPGIGTFGASSGLIEYESPRQSSAVDREVYKITYIDPTFQFRAYFEAGLTGARVTTYLGLFNSTASPVMSGGVSIPPGQPLTGAEDLIIAYSGWVDTQGYTIDPDSGTVIAVLEGSSPMASLDMSKPFRTTKEDMRTVNLNDTSFDEIYTGVSRVSYAWGKAAPGSGNT